MASANVITISEFDIQYELPDDFQLRAGKSKHYIETLQQINQLPFSKGVIYYSDDVWDFSQYTSLNVQKSKLKFNFSGLADTLKDDAKNYVLLKILENKNKVQSIHRNYSEVRKFFNYLADRNIFHGKDAGISIIKDYLQTVRGKNSIIALRFAKGVLKDYYMQYCANFEDISTPGLLSLFDQDSVREYKAHQNAHKSADIPQEYYNKFVSACMTMLNDESLDFAYRGAAGVYIILSQTGLRIGEILGITADGLKTVRIFDGQEADYLEYQTWKRESGNNTASTVRTFVNPLCRQAFVTLLKIYDERRKELGMNYLYMGGTMMNTADSFPIDTEAFRRQAWRFLVKMDDMGLLETVNLPDSAYPMLVHAKTTDQQIKCPKRLSGIVQTITYPDTQQFRFHVCTELHRQGVPLKYVQTFMSHLTFDMARYHVHPVSTPQENMEYSLKILREVVTGKTRLLGDGKGLSEKIQDFIQKNNFRVETDLDEICRLLAEKIPIRQKTGGVCIKSSQLRDCSKDGPTNEFYCAYGVCPNIYHFYYMADISYRQCKELTETIAFNRTRNHMKQVQKETNMLQTIASKRLIPELDELKAVIKREGIEQVYLEHPELQEIIENLETIEKEADAWKSFRL